MADDDDADYAIVGEFLSRLDKIDRLLLWDGNRIGWRLDEVFLFLSGLKSVTKLVFIVSFQLSSAADVSWWLFTSVDFFLELMIIREN